MHAQPNCVAMSAAPSRKPATRTEKTKYPNVYRCHARDCGWRDGRCSCKPRYEAGVYIARERKLLRKRFDTLGAARTWREDAAGAVRKGVLKAPVATTVREAANEWLAGARGGTIRTRSGDPYKPSSIRGYDRGLKLRVVPELGHVRLSALTRNDVQDLADRLLAAGLDPSTVRNTLNPLQAIYRRAVHRGTVAVNPTAGLELPAARGRRERFASREEAARLIAALPDTDRALWATAFYAGLRRGELRALRWDDISLPRDEPGGLIQVERAWDDRDALILTKTRAGRRAVPIGSRLRRELAAHKLRTGRDGAALVFGATATEPFKPATIRRRALRTWTAVELPPITLHEARHTAASFFIAAGVNLKALSVYMGHASITITLDRYGHLLPGAELEAAAQLDAYLDGGMAVRSVEGAD